MFLRAVRDAGTMTAGVIYQVNIVDNHYIVQDQGCNFRYDVSLSGSLKLMYDPLIVSASFFTTIVNQIVQWDNPVNTTFSYGQYLEVQSGYNILRDKFIKVKESQNIFASSNFKLIRISDEDIRQSRKTMKIEKFKFDLSSKWLDGVQFPGINNNQALWEAIAVVEELRKSEDNKK